MIKTITGNWYRNWSPNREAVVRVCKVEPYLENEGYQFKEKNPIWVLSDQVVFDNRRLLGDEILRFIDGKEFTDGKDIGQLLQERIGKDNELYRLISGLRNIAPCKWNKENYRPGKVEVRYRKNKDYLDLSIGVPSQFCALGEYCPDQVIFDGGSTKRLIVEVAGSDEDFVKELVKRARGVLK